MKGGKTPLGYTIVEVMIVLAVSGLMFLVASNFINGKQERASFTEGTHEMASQIQNVIEQVTDGQFSDIPLNCSFNGASTNVQAGANGQGTNSSCVFLGKLFRFYSGGNASTYRILSLAAGRVTTNAGGDSIAPTLQNTHPAVITDLTNLQNIPQHLTVSSITVTDVDGSVHGDNRNFGFAEGLGSFSGDSFQSGAQELAMIYSPVVAPVSDGGPSEDDTPINDHLAYAKSAVMCLTDGTRHAQILIGGAAGDASQLSVNVQVVQTC